MILTNYYKTKSNTIKHASQMQREITRDLTVCFVIGKHVMMVVVGENDRDCTFDKWSKWNISFCARIGRVMKQ